MEPDRTVPAPAVAEPQFTIAHQKVELDLNFSQLIAGKTEITIYPESKSLKTIRLDARQCRVSKVLINGLPPSSITHEDPCDQLTLHTNATVHQHHILEAKIDRASSAKPKPNLVIDLPKKLRIVEVNVTEVHTQNAGAIKIADASAGGVDAMETTQALTDTSVAKFTPLVVSIEFASVHMREAVQFVSGQPGSGRWPHAYTRGKTGGANAAALFPCVDSINARCTWDLVMTCPRTVGDAVHQSLAMDFAERLEIKDAVPEHSRPSYEAKEMRVICSGELVDEFVDKDNTSRKTVAFSCSQQLSAQQIGFAIGPFEQVKLSELRDAQEMEELGRNAVEMIGYCLPGRMDETKNTCLPTTKAIDSIVRKYSACPAKVYAMCFVEDHANEVSIFAGISLCSTRMLYPEEVIDTAQEVTRLLVHSIASQWVGINIIPESAKDAWVIIGIAHFITDLFMKDLCGNNEYRYRMKTLSDRVYELDHDRPTMYDMGEQIHVDPLVYEFIATKAPVVLFILDRRIAKSAGASKMPGIIGKILTRARTGDLQNNALSMDVFVRTVERFYHQKIDDFIEQWVTGAGCPRFTAFQRFNKKKLVVEMLIKQVQGVAMERELDPDTFMRDAREELQDIYAANPQPVFKGPMTIRIHEADGTPYEHIVQIKDASTTFDIPYNTKYKRLKRNKRQKTRPSARNTGEGGEEDNDSLVYCLGDTLQSEEEIADWRIAEWSVEDEERMSAESYEWIRLDADFEWICRIDLQMPGYMFTSQLQQDRDVVAQLEAVRAIGGYGAQPLVSSILIRTLMDKRYFHGVRSLAAQSLARHATDAGDMNWIGLYHLRKAFEELFCISDQGSSITQPNDFSDHQAYMIQCEIVETIARVRNSKGHTPKDVKLFLLDKLKFNDNSMNDVSDAFYVARVMKALSNAIVARPPHQVGDDDMDVEFEQELHEMQQIEQDCLAEIDRYRRMDEWTSSYQNLYSRTALECQSILAHAGVGTFSPLHFLQYTRPGNYDMLRLTAYKVLIQPSILEMPSVLRYVLHCMVADSSPWIRQNLQVAFGRVLGKRAIGNKALDLQPASDGLVIEDANVADARQMELVRRQSIEGAIAALKRELGEHETLRTGLWNAVNYSEITLEDLQPLLEFCQLLYEPVDEAKVTLRYPRYWMVQNQSEGKLKFSRSSKVRTKKMEKWQPPAQPAKPPSQLPKSSNQSLKLKLFTKASAPPPQTAPTPPAVQTTPPQPGRVVLKFGRPASKA